MIFLGSTVAGPACDVRGVLAAKRHLLQALPRPLQGTLSIRAGRCSASAKVGQDFAKREPIRGNRLRDDRIEREVDRRAVIHVQDQALEVTPQRFNNHCRALARDAGVVR